MLSIFAGHLRLGRCVKSSLLRRDWENQCKLWWPHHEVMETAIIFQEVIWLGLSAETESPSSVTRKSSSSVTRTCFLNCDAVPPLWREVGFCVAGVALCAIDGLLVWRVLGLVTSTLRSCGFPKASLPSWSGPFPVALIPCSLLRLVVRFARSAAQVHQNGPS